MKDPFQEASIQQQMYKKKVNKRTNALITSMVGLIVAVAGLYIVDVFFNIIEKKSFKEIFNVRSPWQAYYASVIAGGINGILVVYLPPKIYSYAAVIILTLIYETLAGLTGLSTLNNEQLVRSIIRDLFIINLVLYILKKVTKKNLVEQTKGQNDESYDEEEQVVFSELIDVTLLSSIILNLSIVSTRYGINQILGIT